MNPQIKGNRSGKVLQNIPRTTCADIFFHGLAKCHVFPTSVFTLPEL